VATSSDLHSNGQLQFLASNPEWAFRPDAAESALRERHSRCLDHHLDRRLVHHRRLGSPRQSRQAMPAQWRHWLQALRLHADLVRHRLQVPPARPVLQPGHSQ
jgi:hypothetical protein